MRLPEAFRSLRYRDFRVFFAARTISQIATRMLARNVLGQGAQAFGFLLAAVGVGAVCGAFTLGTVVSRHPPLAWTAGAPRSRARST